MNIEARDFVREWKRTPWFDSTDYEIADEVLEVIEENGDVVEKIDDMLGRWLIIRYVDMLLDLRSLVSPSAEEWDEEEWPLSEPELVST